MTYNVFDIAEKLLHCTEREVCGEMITNMRLQKLLYYEQGYHLAMFGTPLFDDDFEAWLFGPVVPSVYEKYKVHEARGIEPSKHKPIELSQKEEELFAEVFDAYADFSTYGLMRKIHGESPWSDVFSVEKHNAISKQSMQNYFKTQLA